MPNFTREEAYIYILVSPQVVRVCPCSRDNLLEKRHANDPVTPTIDD
jgi:hypothetical protein